MDLYAGLELPKKRKHEEVKEQVQEAKKPKTEEKKPLDLKATVAKLRGYMVVDKKFAKASKLFTQLIASQLTEDTRELFVDTLTQLIEEKGSVWSGRKEFQTLVEALDAKRDVVVKGREQMQRTLDAWKFLAITHAQLFTDETYQFNKAAKVVKLRFEELVSSTSEMEDEERAKRLHTELMPPLRTLYSKLHVAWATTIVEGVLALGTRHRLMFSEEDRKEVDSWTKGMRDRRSAPAVARSAGSEARRNIVATNEANRSEAGAKVPGRYNHPLFNKEL